MSEREQVRQIVDSLPEYKINGLLVFLQAFSEDIPNAETLAAFAELDNGGGKVYTGSTEDMIADILASED